MIGLHKSDTLNQMFAQKLQELIHRESFTREDILTYTAYVENQTQLQESFDQQLFRKGIMATFLFALPLLLWLMITPEFRWYSLATLTFAFIGLATTLFAYHRMYKIIHQKCFIHFLEQVTSNQFPTIRFQQ